MPRRDPSGKLRHEAGAPSSHGGQFATDTSPAASTDLTWEDAQALQRLQRLITKEVTRRFGDRVDPEDVLSIMHEKAAVALAEGKFQNLRDNVGYLRQVARSAAVDVAYPGQPNGRTRKAVRVLTERVEAFAEQQGHNPSSADFARIAHEVRESFPPGGRPVKDFHLHALPKQDFELDAAIRDPGGLTYADQLEASEASSPLTAWEQLASHRESRFGRRGLSDQQVKERLWAVARRENDDVPPVVHLPPKQLQDVRDAFDQLDVAGVLTNYDYDGDHTAGLATIMAPFGGMNGTTQRQRAAVIETLARNPKFAGHLWRLALDQAAKRH